MARNRYIIIILAILNIKVITLLVILVFQFHRLLVKILQMPSFLLRIGSCMIFIVLKTYRKGRNWDQMLLRIFLKLIRYLNLVILNCRIISWPCLLLIKGELSWKTRVNMWWVLQGLQLTPKTQMISEFHGDLLSNQITFLTADALCLMNPMKLQNAN